MDRGGGLGAPFHEPPVEPDPDLDRAVRPPGARPRVHGLRVEWTPNSQTTPRTDKVAVLGGVADLRERFNEDSGKVRLVLLISPT